MGQTTTFATALFNFNALNISVNAVLVAYLIMTLITVVELTNSFKGALEQRIF